MLRCQSLQKNHIQLAKKTRPGNRYPPPGNALARLNIGINDWHLNFRILMPMTCTSLLPLTEDSQGTHSNDVFKTPGGRALCLLMQLEKNKKKT